MVEENPRVGGRLKSDAERLQERDFEGGGRREIKKKKKNKNSVRILGKILCE